MNDTLYVDLNTDFELRDPDAKDYGYGKDKNEMETEYFNWLVDSIRCREDGHTTGYAHTHQDMLWLLHCKEFCIPAEIEGTVLNSDINRIYDALYERKVFADTFEYNHFHEDSSVSVLEILCSLAYRMWMTSPTDKRFNSNSECFDCMIRSLGLTNLEDLDLRLDSARLMVAVLLDNLCHHRYSANGENSLFYIPDLDESIDMRELDIWTQMTKYLEYWDSKVSIAVE